jgi:hypothetical protein
MKRNMIAIVFLVISCDAPSWWDDVWSVCRIAFQECCGLDRKHGELREKLNESHTSGRAVQSARALGGHQSNNQSDNKPKSDNKPMIAPLGFDPSKAGVVKHRADSRDAGIHSGYGVPSFRGSVSPNGDHFYFYTPRPSPVPTSFSEFYTPRPSLVPTSFLELPEFACRCDHMSGVWSHPIRTNTNCDAWFQD